MNITLSIDPKLLEKARRAAGDMGISLNELVRRYLQEITGEGDRSDAFAEFRNLSLGQGGHSAGRTWTREDLHLG